MLEAPVASSRGHDMRLLGLSVLISFALTCVTHASANPTGEPVDTSIEIATALYRAHITRDATHRELDDKLRVLKDRIDKLSERGDPVKAERAAAQDLLVRELSRRDFVYAEEITALRLALMQIAKTAEGRKALARYNAWDPRGGISQMDVLHARINASNKERVATARAIARLAHDNWSKGLFGILELIARKEEIVRLDPSASQDWLDLARLYFKNAQLPEAKHAVERALRTAKSRQNRAAALELSGDILAIQLAPPTGTYHPIAQNIWIDVFGLPIKPSTDVNLSATHASYAKSLRIRRRLAGDSPSSPRHQRDLWLILDKMAGLHMHKREYANARSSYQEALDIARRLAGAFPNSRSRRMELAERLERIGNVQAALGDLANARAAYEESINTDPLYGNEPPLADLQNGIRMQLCFMGHFLRAQGNLDAARLVVADCLRVARRLADADPSNAQFQVNVSLTLELFASVAAAQSDPSAARAAYEESVAILRRLAETDPTSSWDWENLAQGLVHLGEFLRAEGDLSGALAAFEQSVTIYRRLARTDKTIAAVYHERVAWRLIEVGNVRRAKGDVAGARAAFEESVVTFRRLIEADNSLPLARIAIVESLVGLGDVLAAQGDLEGARAMYTESLKRAQRNAAEEPHRAGTQRAVWESMWRMAQTPDSGVNWSDVVALMEDLDRRNLLLSGDRPQLETARRNAARQKR